MVFGSKALLVSILSTLLLACSADFMPGLEKGQVPTSVHVKERIAPPKDQQLYNVFYAKGHRIYQCNPERRRFMRWYNVQNQAFLYATKGKTAPFDVPGNEIGQMNSAPMNKTLQMLVFQIPTHKVKLSRTHLFSFFFMQVRSRRALHHRLLLPWWFVVRYWTSVSWHFPRRRPRRTRWHWRQFGWPFDQVCLDFHGRILLACGVHCSFECVGWCPPRQTCL